MPFKPSGKRDSMPPLPEPGVDAYGDGPFLIDYRPARGEPSLRWITVTGATSSTSVSAHCHERNARRTFRHEHIFSATTPDGDVYEARPTAGAMRQVLDPFRSRGPIESRYD